MTDQTCISRSKTNPPSSLGLLLVVSWASSGSVRPMESTPNKVSQQRARSPAERHAQTSLGPNQSTLLFIYLFKDGLLSTILMNASCPCASQSGTSYLARNQPDANGFAGASYVCWLIDHFPPFFYIDCLVTNKGIHPTSIPHTVFIWWRHPAECSIGYV